MTPLPLSLLLRRARLELARESKIFDLPAAAFFRGLPGLDLSVSFHGHRAATPLGPAAGPHGQLAQNIALSWLAGARIIELKTIQILDDLKIPRPCIDAANVGYNVEWSQELTLEQSLREYVKASMLVEILQAELDLPPGFVFDMSVGYNLDGIRSPRVRDWIASMRNAAALVDELRPEAGAFRDHPFRTCISDTIALSTFHGCPAGEIEGIVTFLLEEMGCHVCVKLNPTLLGRDAIAYLLHDVLGYHEIQLHPPAFENDLQWDEALDLIPRLQRIARSAGRGLSLKFTNTLVVKNHKQVLEGDLMYMSGAPLHPIAVALAEKFRAAHREPIPISFSGGVDAHNFADAVAMDFVPVTTCTDLLRTGGYQRLHRYLENLGERIRAVGAATISEFLNRVRPLTAGEIARNPRYHYDRNHGTPRKIGTSLWFYDCINCDKCVPVCPNDANFVYETTPRTISYDNFEFRDGVAYRVPGGTLRIVHAHQLANFADACNECGNCDIFCPEDGGPFLAKPRFFSGLETLRNGFFLDGPTIHADLDGHRYSLCGDRFTQDGIVIEMSGAGLQARPVASEQPSAYIDMLPYLKLTLLQEALSNPEHVNYANATQLS